MGVLYFEHPAGVPGRGRRTNSTGRMISTNRNSDRGIHEKRESEIAESISIAKAEATTDAFEATLEIIGGV